MVATDVSRQPIGRIFKDKQSIEALTLNTGLTGCPETSVSTNLRCVTSQKSEDLKYNAIYVASSYFIRRGAGSTYEPSRVRPTTYCVSEYRNTTFRAQLHAHSVLACSNWSLLYTAARLDIPPVLINSSELVPLGTRMF